MNPSREPQDVQAGGNALGRLQPSERTADAVPSGGVASRSKEIIYGSAEYTNASEIVRALRQSGLHSLLLRPGGYRKMLTAFLTVWRLPSTELVLNREEARSWFGKNFPPAGHKLAGSRWAQLVLTLEPDEAKYVSGRPKQALRTNLRQARTAGVVTARVDYPAFDAAARQILIARRGAPDHTLAVPEPQQRVSYYVANAQDGTPLVFAGVASFGNFGLLFIMISHPDHPDASPARYLIHTHLLMDQARNGISYLLSGPAFNEVVGIQYFQHLLGYRARNLKYNVV